MTTFQDVANRIEEDGPLTMTKTDIKAAITATNTWLDGNKASFLAALPSPFKGKSTAAQKLALFLAVVKEKYE